MLNSTLFAFLLLGQLGPIQLDTIDETIVLSEFDSSITSLPTVDDSESMVIGIVEKPKRFRAQPPVAPNTVPSGRLNIGFAHDPGQGKYDGVVGSPNDVWNFVDIGTTAVDYTRHADASSSTARLRIARHDGEWGIEGHTGIFHGYIYHNCRCVDLEATLLDLEPDRYRAYIYAHGDAPNQNAKIEVIVGDRTIGQKATANDETWDFRSTEFINGVQYVTFTFAVAAGDQVRIISHRDGSDYSMLNAIQLVPVSH